MIKSVNGGVGRRSRGPGCRPRPTDRPDIDVRDGYESAERQRALMAACDCYVSLHRAEGYGLTLAEAMAAGRPVIGTAYSGNLEFMTPDTSVLVPYELERDPVRLRAVSADRVVGRARHRRRGRRDARRMASDPAAAARLGAQRPRAHGAAPHAPSRELNSSALACTS